MITGYAIRNFACVLFFLMSANPVWATWSVLSGRLLSTEPVIHNFDNGCWIRSEDLGYQLVTPLTVSRTGSYSAASINGSFGLDVYFAIYRGGFDPEDPELNLLAEYFYDDAWGLSWPVTVQLRQGVEYTLVVLPWCTPEKGTWTIAFNGAGRVNSGATVAGLDSFQFGRFDNTSSVANIGCGAAKYHATGPHRVSRSGSYVLIDATVQVFSGICVDVLSAPFDPQNPKNNVVQHSYSYGQKIDLEEGQDYYFVVTPKKGNLRPLSEYAFLIEPWGEVYFDPVLSGSWYNPETPGQGFFLDVLGDQNRVFLGWFTYDLERPETDNQVTLGDSSHRWLTAFGYFNDAAANMDITVTSGGVFNERLPAPVNRPGGTLTLRFLDCQTGEVAFKLDEAAITGTIPIQRISAEAIRRCENLMNHAGAPGPLMEQ